MSPVILKKISHSQYSSLECDWLASGSRDTLGRWFLKTRFPSVTDNVLWNAKATQAANHAVLIHILTYYVKDK